MMGRIATRGRVVLVGSLLFAGGALFWFVDTEEPFESSGAESPVGTLGNAVAGRAADDGDDLIKGAAIEGMVKDHRGLSVPNAMVLLSRVQSVQDTADIPLAVGSRRTPTNGQFVFDQVPPGKYAVTAMARGFAPAHQGALEITAGARQSVTLTLSSGGFALSGQVLDAGHGAIPGATVQAVAYSAGPAPVAELFQATADDAGDYRLWLAPGAYQLTVQADGYSPLNDSVTLDGNVTRDLLLMPSARLQGRVVERGTGIPVAGADVWVLSDRLSNQLTARDVKTDGQGKFALNDLPGGTFSVAARAGMLVGFSSFLSVSAMQAITDVQVEMDPGLTIAGRVSDSREQGLGGVILALSKRDPPFDRTISAKSRGDGTFLLEGILPGRYSLRASGEGFTDAETELSLASESMQGVLIKLDAQAAIVGLVVTGGGQPVGQATVNAEMSVEEPGGGRNVTMRTEKADGQGKFRFAGVRPSSVILYANHPEHGADETAALPIRAGETRQLTITLRAADTASVSGRITYDDGVAAAGMRVTAALQSASGRFHNATGVSGPDGSYQLMGLVAGTAEVEVRFEANGIMSSPRKVITLRGRETRSGLDFRLPRPNKMITGQVVGPQGERVVGAAIGVSPESAAGPNIAMAAHRGALTDEEGSFTIQNLPKGKYRLVASHSSYPDAVVNRVEAGTSGVRVRLTAQSSLAGVVVGADGKPTTDYTVVLSPALHPPGGREGSAAPPTADAGDQALQRVRHPTGAFSFDRLSPGAYSLKVTAGERLSGRTTVTVKSGERKADVRVVLGAGVRIKGKVVDQQTRQPLVGAVVLATATGGGPDTKPAQSDAHGAFALENIPADPSLRVFAATDGYAPSMKELDVASSPGDLDVGTIELQRVASAGAHGPSASTTVDEPSD